MRLVRERYIAAVGPQGLPFFKPPYGRLTAIDLNTGEIVRQKANGEGPRDHPAIRHLGLRVTARSAGERGQPTSPRARAAAHIPPETSSLKWHPPAICGTGLRSPKANGFFRNVGSRTLSKSKLLVTVHGRHRLAKNALACASRARGDHRKRARTSRRGRGVAEDAMRHADDSGTENFAGAASGRACAL